MVRFRPFLLACLMCWQGLLYSPALARHPLAQASITPRALRAEAINQYIKGDTDSALDIYEQALELASKQYGAQSGYVGDLYYEMGSIALQDAKFQRAEGYLTEAVRLRPNSITARAKLVDLLLLRGRPDEAREQAKSAVIKHPNSLEARQAYAGALVASGAPARALLAYASLDSVRHGLKTALPVAPRTPVPATTGAAAPPPPTKPAAKVQPAKPATKPAPKPEPKPKPEARPKPAPKPKPVPKPKEKPKPKPVQEAKPPLKPKPQAKPERKPSAKAPELKARPLELKAKPAELKARPQEPKAKPRGKRSPGLVPPPPPVVPMVPIIPGFVPPPPPGAAPVGAGSPGFQIKTEAKLKPQPKPKETAKEEPSHAGASGEDADFLLEWGDVEKKKKKH